MINIVFSSTAIFVAHVYQFQQLFRARTYARGAWGWTPL